MKQNIYDTPAFFDGYMALRATESGLNVAIEEPAVRALLPPLAGRAVLDLGCGFGKFAGYCLEHDVERVTGFDISAKMIAEARARYRDARCVFAVCAIEDLDLQDGAFDVAIASLCLHYVKDIGPLLQQIAAALRPGGRFVFSVEHPVCTALLSGWHGADAASPEHWPVDRYFDESMRKARWFVDGVIKYHRTIESYVAACLEAGLRITSLQEPRPTNAAIAAQPALAAHTRRPPVLVIAGDK